MRDSSLPHYEVHPGEGPYLLMVHGMLSSRAQWTPNLEALAKVGQPVVVELFGHGRSPAPTARDAYRPEGYAQAFERIRETLGAERWVLIGQSLGAALTLRYALDHPERVLAHVTTNSNSAFSDEGWAEAISAGMDRFASQVEREGLAAIERMAIHPKHAKRIAPELLEPLLRDAAALDPQGVIHSACETVPNSALAERLPENRVPTLLANGIFEKAFQANCERARRIMPLLEVVEPEAGHPVNLNAAAPFNAAVADFLRRHIERAA